MKITLSLAQIDVAIDDPERNLEKGARYIEEASKRGSDLIIFPELWTTGFNPKTNRKLAHSHKEVIEKIAALAKNFSLWIHGSTLEEGEDGLLYNSSTLFNPKGEKVALYKKIHLFSYADEDKVMKAGNKLTIAETTWGKIGFSICYDIRFPELYRSYALQGVKMMLNPIAFPHPRYHHWETLSKARAIENQMFMVSVNQVGEGEPWKGKKTNFFGSSAIIDPWGEIVIQGSKDKEILLTAEINLADVDRTRQTIKVFDDRRPDLYQI